MFLNTFKLSIRQNKIRRNFLKLKPEKVNKNIKIFDASLLYLPPFSLLLLIFSYYPEWVLVCWYFFVSFAPFLHDVSQMLLLPSFFVVPRIAQSSLDNLDSPLAPKYCHRSNILSILENILPTI